MFGLQLGLQLSRTLRQATHPASSEAKGDRLLIGMDSSSLPRFDHQSAKKNPSDSSEVYAGKPEIKKGEKKRLPH